MSHSIVTGSPMKRLLQCSKWSLLYGWRLSLVCQHRKTMSQGHQQNRVGKVKYCTHLMCLICILCSIILLIFCILVGNIVLFTPRQQISVYQCTNCSFIFIFQCMSSWLHCNVMASQKNWAVCMYMQSTHTPATSVTAKWIRHGQAKNCGFLQMPLEAGTKSQSL